MTREVWLRPNPRVFWLAAFFSAAVSVTGLVGAGVAVWSWRNQLLLILSVLLVVVGLYMLAVALYALRQPRLAYADGALLVYLAGGKPVRVPIEVVECFFLGQAPSLLGGKDDETSTVVVRLAESAKDWQHVQVRRNLGHWCDGYITIRGTWCEPLSGELVQELNDRLVQAHRQVRSSENQEHS